MEIYPEAGRSAGVSLTERRKRISWWTVLLSHVYRVLGSRYWPVALAVAAVAVSLPAVGAGLLNDDFMQRTVLIGPSPFLTRLAEVGLEDARSGQLLHSLSDMFIAVDPDVNLGSLKAYGALPWWTYDGMLVSFWRPVAALTSWVDYRLFPHSPVLMHVHSIFWFAVAVLAAAMLYRRYMPTAWVAGLAGLLFLLDDSSYFPTLWLANRNLLISLAFGLLALIAHDAWRRGGRRFAAIAAPVCLLVSLLAAEAGIATAAYLFAYEVALDRGRLRRRFRALLPAFAIVVSWRLLYNLQGYGARGGGFYFDPVREPLGYLMAILRRAPFLLGGQWTTVPADLHNFLPPSTRALVGLLLGLAAILIPLGLLPLLRASRRARFWLMGMYLAVLPFCATIPMGRTLLFVAVGAFGLVAELMAGWHTQAEWVPGGGGWRHTIRVLAILSLVVHVPLALGMRLTAPAMTTSLGSRVAQTVAPDELGLSGQDDLIIVNAPNPMALLYEPYRRAYKGRPLPRAIRMLAPAFNTVHVTREADRRLVLRAATRSLLDCEEGGRMDHVFFYRLLSDVRGERHPLRVGQQISLLGMQVEVLAVDDSGFPAEAAFDFDVPLEHGSLEWLQWSWDSDSYEPFPVPTVGETVTLPGPF